MRRAALSAPMTRILAPMTLGLAAVVVSAGAIAVAEPTDDPAARYSLSPVDGGALRLDRKTGAMSMCRESEGKWACTPIDDNAQRETETVRLQRENKELRERVKTLEETIDAEVAGANGDAIAPAPPSAPMQLPSEEDVDKALDYVERIFKKFRDRVRKYEQPGMESPTLPSPDDKGIDEDGAQKRTL